MARKDPRPEVNRRKFLAGVAVAGAATAVSPPQNAANAGPAHTKAASPAAAAVSPTVLACLSIMSSPIEATADAALTGPETRRRRPGD